jgi:hypothetical protein
MIVPLRRDLPVARAKTARTLGRRSRCEYVRYRYRWPLPNGNRRLGRVRTVRMSAPAGRFRCSRSRTLTIWLTSWRGGEEHAGYGGQRDRKRARAVARSSAACARRVTARVRARAPGRLTMTRGVRRDQVARGCCVARGRGAVLIPRDASRRRSSDGPAVELQWMEARAPETMTITSTKEIQR